MQRVGRAFGATAVLVLISEAVHFLVSRRLARIRDVPGTTTAVIVLGYGAPRHGLRGALQSWRAEITTVQRWRAEIAVRTLAAAGPGCVIFSGSGDAAGSRPSEAEAMAAYATSELGLDPDCVRIEASAAHTWQNVAYSLGLAETCDRVAIASDPLHAARAARYAARQRPDLTTRLCAAATYRLFERWWLKVPITPYEGWRWIRDRGFERRERGPG